MMNDPFETFESALNLNSDSSNNQAFNGFETDPAADFLAREQAEFAKIENNDFSNDTFGDFSSQNTAAPVLSNGFDENDPFGLGSSVETNSTTEIKQSNVSLSLKRIFT